MINDIKYVNGYYDRYEDKVYLLYRNNGILYEKKFTFNWYFYIHRKDAHKLPPTVKYLNKEIWGDYLKIYMPYKQKMQNEKHLNLAGVCLYEYDLDPLQRFMIDNQIKIAEEYKIGYIDIETDDRSDDINIGKNAITSVSIWEAEGKTFSFCSKNEVDVLLNLYREALKYDILVGWNSIRFEKEVINGRFEAMSKVDKRIPARFPWHKIIHIDLMDRIKFSSANLGGSLALDNIALKLLGEGKVEVPRPLYNLLDTDPELLKKYNLKDCELVARIENKLRIIELMIRQATFCGIFLSQYFISTLLDGLMFRYARTRKIALPTRLKRDKEEYLGAQVLEPVKGLFKNVCIFDFNSLYPSAIRSWNISFDTKIAGNIEEDNIIKSAYNDIKFTKNQGLFSMVLSDLLDKRAQIKSKYSEIIDEQEKKTMKIWEMGYKELANSLYGLTGNPSSRFYDLDIAQSITVAGRYCLNAAKRFFESKGYQVLSGDTDSVFVEIADYTPERIQVLLPEFQDFLASELKRDFNIDKTYIKLGYQSHYQKFIVVMKKNYIGWDGNNYIIKGLELIKSDTIYITKLLQYYLITALTKLDKDVNFYIDMITKFRLMFRTKKFDVKYISIHQKLSKKLEEYKSQAPHVRLAKKKHLDDMIGETINYVVINSEESAMANIIKKSFSNIKDYRAAVKVAKEEALDNGLILASEYTGEFDRAYMWQHKVFNALGRILEVVFKEHDWEKFKKLNPQEDEKHGLRSEKVRPEAVQEN